MTRIIDKINSIRKKSNSLHVRNQNKDNSNGEYENLQEHEQQQLDPQGWYYSFEFFPPKTEAGLDNLFTRIDRMSTRLDPLFIDVTWGESGSTSVRSMAIASHAQRYCGVDVLLHLTCTGMTREQLSAVLRQARSHGVQNILALRGDPPRGKRSWSEGDVSGGECDRAIDLIRLIRELHGDYFCIACAGHPEGHPASGSREEELGYLKEKIDDGADFVITQFFYDADLFLDYVKSCRGVGIICPIIPGILPIQTYSTFIRMTEFCNISVPPHVLERLEPVKEDDEAVKIIGCEIAKDIAMQILTTPEEDGGMDGIHFYTLNLERSVTRILMAMKNLDLDTALNNTTTSTSHTVNVTDMVDKGSSGDMSTPDSINKNNNNNQQQKLRPPSPHGLASRRQFPWRPSAMESRVKEDVRPINWANRPKSYVMRTDDWDEFPNGRWGDSTSPAFGELSELSHFYSYTIGSEEDRLVMLGPHPTVPQDVYEVFAMYVEGKVPHLPWCETALKPESFTIQAQLAALNRAGFLTVNSQPPVNGASSSNPVFGWGGAGGYVYQKGYCECFVSPENAQKLVEMVRRHPSMSLYAVNNHGEEMEAEMDIEERGVTALTWGVFPNREILQPTIFDPDTFLIWAEEAFSLWTSMWQHLYEMESDSFDLIGTIRDTYFLVAIIDNDFVTQTEGGKLWEALLEIGKVSS
jgi:methylenetetrahydrofolate reductase (NADPH)